MANDGASGADRSDNKSSDRSNKSERAERDVSEKSRDTLSGGDTATKEGDRPATPAERAAGQERMAAAGQAAKTRTEQETRKAGFGTPSPQTETSAAAETAPGTDPTLTEVPQVDPETLPQTLREQMIDAQGGIDTISQPDLADIDEFLETPEGIEASRQYEFARGLQVSGLDTDQTIEAMAHFNAGREVAFDVEGRIQLDDAGRVQLTEPIAYADSGQIMTDAPQGPTATETLVEYARGLNNAVEQVANSNFAWAAGVAFQGLALAAGGPVRFAISQGVGWAVGQVAEKAIGWAAGEIATRTGMPHEDVSELAIAGGTILGSIAGVVTWKSIRRDLFNDLDALRHNTIGRVRDTRTTALDAFRGREITAADLTNGTLAGHSNAGPGTRHFERWLENDNRSLEVTAEGSFRYSVRITDPNSPLNGQTVGITFDRNGVPDFAAYSLGRVDITVDAHRTGSNASLRATDSERATAVLWEAIEAGNIDRSRFTPAQLAAIEDGSAQIPGLTWHHDGQALNQDGTGPMMLLPTEVHSPFGHWGWFSKARE